MSGTDERMRAWTGLALFTFGFRPFFLGATVWAALAMVIWIAMLAGRFSPPTTFDPLSWHAHEFLFGYVGAVISGFLFTAVPNWTGRSPTVGWPLAGIFALWLAGRIAVAFSLYWPWPVTASIDLALPVVLSAVMTREIVAGRNWRNLIVVGLLAGFAVGDGLFHLEAAQGGLAARGHGLRLGLGAAIMMIGVIGGRIIPSFTRNWLNRRGAGRLPAAPMQSFDKAALVTLLASLLIWIVAPYGTVTSLALAVSAVLHFIRLGRWAGERTLAEPLVWVLHLGYAFLPIGALALAWAALTPAIAPEAPAQHIWMAGAIGLMTLAVMTRATRGHTGRDLVADAGTTTLYVALVIAVIARVAAGLWPAGAPLGLDVAAVAWIGAFAGFAILYGPMLVQRRPPA